MSKYALLDGSCGIVAIEIDICEECFLKLLDEYKTIDENYNSQDFIKFLSDKGLKATLIKILETYN